MYQSRFVLQGIEEPGWVAFLVVTGVAVLVCVWLLYRNERRLVSAQLGFTLLALRLAAVLTVLLTLLEPVIHTSLDRDQTGRVVVAIDVSDSMGTADKEASRAEKLRWARALGLIGNDETAGRLDAWIAAYEANEEPVWVEEGETSDPVRRRALTESRRDNLAQVFETIDTMPRKEIARRLLAGGGRSVLDQLNELAVVELAIFAGKSTSAEAQTLEDAIATPPRSLLLEQTDLSEPVTSAFTSDEDGPPLQAIVVLTDGQDNINNSDGRLASQLGGLGVPIHNVLIGSTNRPKDIAIGVVDVPTTVYVDDSPVLKASILASGFEGEEITVTLQRTDAPGVPAQVRNIRPTGPSTDVRFELTADELGRQQYEIVTEVQEGESRDDNNRKAFSINVVDDKTHVLLVDGAARWEFRFVNNALERDERVGVDSVLFDQPYIGVLPETFFARSLPPLPDANDNGPTMFSDYDAVLIGDVPPTDLRPEHWRQLERFVREEGGTLIMQAGRRYFPMHHRSPIVDRLLPLEELKIVSATDDQQMLPPSRRGLRLRLTADGRNQAMFQFVADPVENRRIWDLLPGQTWLMKGVARPGATVFVNLPERGNGVRSALNAERRSAVVVHQNVGAGQTLFVGFDGTWRWRHRVGDEYHHRFWGQLARWAADFKAMSGNEFVRFGPVKAEVSSTEEAIIQARWDRRFRAQHPEVAARAEVWPADPDADAPITTIDLIAAERGALTQQARISALEPGAYRLKLKTEGDILGLEPIEADLIITEQLTTELSELSANRGLLSQISDKSGGQLLSPDEVNQLPRLFEGVIDTSRIEQTRTLWDSWLTLLLLFALMTAEWVLRKWNGLP